ncbi:uncharacterized protein EI97DRAFT_480943, partial [Westerdykella ornata]
LRVLLNGGPASLSCAALALSRSCVPSELPSRCVSTARARWLLPTSMTRRFGRSSDTAMATSKTVDIFPSFLLLGSRRGLCVMLSLLPSSLLLPFQSLTPTSHLVTGIAEKAAASCASCASSTPKRKLICTGPQRVHFVVAVACLIPRSLSRIHGSLTDGSLVDPNPTSQAPRVCESSSHLCGIPILWLLRHGSQSWARRCCISTCRCCTRHASCYPTPTCLQRRVSPSTTHSFLQSVAACCKARAATHALEDEQPGASRGNREILLGKGGFVVGAIFQKSQHPGIVRPLRR